MTAQHHEGRGQRPPAPGRSGGQHLRSCWRSPPWQQLRQARHALALTFVGLSFCSLAHVYVLSLTAMAGQARTCPDSGCLLYSFSAGYRMHAFSAAQVLQGGHIYPLSLAAEVFMSYLQSNTCMQHNNAMH